jgi:hypothetical protein
MQGLPITVLTALGAQVPIEEAMAHAEKIPDSTINRPTTSRRLTNFLLARRGPINGKRYKK